MPGQTMAVVIQSEKNIFPVNTWKYCLFMPVFPRFVAQTIRPTLVPVTCLLPNAEWREPNGDTSCSWIILEPANVSSGTTMGEKSLGEYKHI